MSPRGPQMAGCGIRYQACQGPPPRYHKKFGVCVGRHRHRQEQDIESFRKSWGRLSKSKRRRHLRVVNCKHAATTRLLNTTHATTIRCENLAGGGAGNGGIDMAR